MRVRGLIAGILLTCFCQAPAQAWVMEGVAIVGAAVGLVNTFTSGKASKASAEAQQATMQALLTNLEALQSANDLILKDLEDLRGKIDFLPASLEMRQAALSAASSVELMLQYAAVLIDRRMFNDDVLLQSNFDRMNTRLAEIDEMITFFRREVVDGDLQSVVNLAMLQEANSIAHRALAVFSVDQGDRPTLEGCFAAVAADGDQATFQRILQEAGLEADRVDCKIQENARGLAAYRALRRFLEEQERIWHELLSTDGPIVPRLKEARAAVRLERIHTDGEQYFSYPEIADMSDLRFVEDMNALIESSDDLYGGITHDEVRDVCLILIPYWRTFTVWDTDNVTYFAPYEQEVPLGAFVWNAATIPEVGVAAPGIVSTVRSELPNDAKFVPFEATWTIHDREDPPLPQDWERRGFAENPATNCVEGAEIYALVFDLMTGKINRRDEIDEVLALLGLNDFSEASVREFTPYLIHHRELVFQRTRHYNADPWSIFAFLTPDASQRFYPSEDNCSAGMCVTASFIEAAVRTNMETTLAVMAFTAAVNARDNTQDQIEMIRRLEDLL